MVQSALSMFRVEIDQGKGIKRLEIHAETDQGNGETNRGRRIEIAEEDHEDHDDTKRETQP